MKINYEVFGDIIPLQGDSLDDAARAMIHLRPVKPVAFPLAPKFSHEFPFILQAAAAKQLKAGSVATLEFADIAEPAAPAAVAK